MKWIHLAVVAVVASALGVLPPGDRNAAADR